MASRWSSSRPVTVKPVPAPTAKTVSLRPTSLPLTECIYYAGLIWTGFALTALLVILPYLLHRRMINFFKLFSGTRWFSLAQNSFDDLAVREKKEQPNAPAGKLDAENVMVKRALNRLGFLNSMESPEDNLPSAEEPLGFSDKTIGKMAENQSNSRYLWYLMERPNLDPLRIESKQNPFKDLAQPQKNTVIREVEAGNADQFLTEDEDWDKASETDLVSGDPSAPNNNQLLDPKRLSDHQYFSTGVEALIKEMMEDAKSQESLVQKGVADPILPVSKTLRPPPVLEVVSSVPAPAVAKLEPLPPNEALLEEKSSIRTSAPYSQTGIVEGVPVCEGVSTWTVRPSEVAVRPSKLQAAPSSTTAVHHCHIDLSKPGRLSKWIPCEVRVSPGRLALRYRNTRDVLVEKDITERSVSGFSFAIPKSIKQGINMSARRFELVTHRGRFRLRAPDHTSQATIMLAIQNQVRRLSTAV